MTDLSGVDTDSLLTAAGLTPNAHPIEQPTGPDLSQVPNDALMKAAGQVSVPIPPPDNAPDPLSVPDQRYANLKAFPGFKMGIGDLYAGGVQFMLHALEATAPSGSVVEKKARELRQAMDDKIATDEANYQKTRAASSDVQDAKMLSDISGQNVQALDVGRLLGNVAGAAPLAAAAPESLPARVAAGALTGGMAGTAQPSTSQGSDYWLEKAKEAAAGAVGGAVAAPLAGGVARVVNPETSQATQTLLDSGVKPTLGQLAGKAAARSEEALTSTPLIGDAIAAGRIGATKDFNRATINQALAPIGEKLGDKTEIGDKAIDEMATKIGANRDALVPQLTTKVDPQFAQDIQSLMSLAQNLSPEQTAQFKKVLVNEVLSKFSPAGTMDGQTFMDVQSAIGKMANDYMHSAVVSERYFGRALNEADDQLNQLLMRSNPQAAQALQANNDAYAMMKRIQAASISSVKSQGVFTPAQLLQAIKQQDTTLGHSAFARGSALMKAYASAGEEILGSKLPDSGTAMRWMAEHPISTLLTTPITAPVAVLNTSIGRKLAALAIANRPSIAAPVSSAVRSLGGPFGGALAGGATEQTSQ